jgi:dTDP-glucose 4,6-dehydratase
MRILVTGGAGFIGSHYVRTMLTGGYPGFEDAEVTVFDKLTYAGNLANLRRSPTRPATGSCRGDICSRRPRRRAARATTSWCNFAAESHVDRSIHGASDFVLTNVLGAQQVFEACAAARVRRVCTSPPTRSTAPSTRARGPRTTSSSRTRPYSAAKAGGTCRPRVREDLRAGHLDHPVQQQLRALPLPREGHPAVRHQPARRAQGAAVRRGRQRARLAVRRRPLPGIQLVSRRGGPASSTTSAAAASCPTRELTEKLLEATGRDWSYVENIVDPRGGGHDLRYSVDYSKTAELGLRAADDLRGRPRADRAVVPRQPGWWEPLKARRPPRTAGPGDARREHRLAGHRRPRAARHRSAGGPRAASGATTSPAWAGRSST